MADVVATTELRNRRAGFDYEILETFEAGLVLTGSEVKSLRAGGGSIAESFARVRGGEVFVEAMNIPQYAQASYNNHEPLRTRKLLLNRREIQELRNGVERRGLAIVPMKLYFKDGRAKLLIGLGRGRKRHDKRQREAEKDAKRQIDAARTRVAGVLLALVLALAAFAPPALAQLVVSGEDLGPYSLELVPGVTYGPAVPLARALGAEIAIGNVVTLRLGGRIVELSLSATAEAAQQPGAFSLGGAETAAPGAVVGPGGIWLPVKAVVEAFGGYLTVMSGASNDIIVTMPRAALESLAPGAAGQRERVVANLTGPVPHSVFYNQPLATLHIRFDRTENRAPEAQLSGRGYRLASALSDRGSTELRIELAPGAGYDVFTVQTGNGYQLIVEFSAAGAPAAGIVEPQPARAQGRILLDPLPSGAADTLALELSRELARELQLHGLEALVTRNGAEPVTPQGRAGQARNADLVLSIAVGGTADGFSLYYLGDAASADDLVQAERLGAELQIAAVPADPGALRRDILLGAMPDLAIGRNFATLVHGGLVHDVGLAGAEALALPLELLTAAGGRGIYLQIGTAAAGAAGLAEAIAAGALQLLGGQP